MNRRMHLLLAASVAVLLFALMALTLRATQPWSGEATEQTVEEANGQSAVVDALFGPQVIAFEVLGILLTAAMIGALVIARPLNAPADEANYTKPTPAQVAESDRASDVATHAAKEASK